MSELDRFFNRIIKRLAHIEEKIEAHDRYQGNMLREGRITKLHADKGVAEVDMDGLPSMKIPWLERAGTQRSWDPPSVDERVLVLSPNGDPGRGLILHGGYSDKFAAPHDKAGERKYQIGESYDTMTGEERTQMQAKIWKAINGKGYFVNITDEGVEIKCGGSSIKLTEAGITLKGKVIKENE